MNEIRFNESIYCKNYYSLNSYLETDPNITS